jgi:succinoglycan biosynthesis protein ExoA
MSRLERVTIIVPCRNEARHIKPFLDSLLRQDVDGIDWEVIIADGSSDDGTREILDSYAADYPHIRIIDNPGRIVSTGLNAAIHEASGDIILRMDAHSEYQSDYIRQCVKVLRITGADNVGGAPRVKAGGRWMTALAAAYHSHFAVGGARSHDPEYEGRVDSVFYGCWRKARLLRLGLFDESLVRNQDDELNLRLVRSGGHIWQSRSIVSWYQPRRSISALWRQQFQYGFWKPPVIRKHRQPGSWRHLVPVFFVVTNIVLLLWMALAGSAETRWLPERLWLAQATAYVSASVMAAFYEASRTKLMVLPLLPLLFAVYHVAYGCGFLVGTIYWLRPGASARGESPAPFARITR